jgi:hypothetical protein
MKLMKLGPRSRCRLAGHNATGAGGASAAWPGTAGCIVGCDGGGHHDVERLDDADACDRMFSHASMVAARELAR